MSIARIIQRFWSVAGFVAILVAPSASRAADFVWTGNGGDFLWSNKDNWRAEDGSAVESGPQEDVAYTYKFETFEDGLIVTQDINVVAKIIAIGKDGDYTTRNTVTWRTAEGKTFRFSDARQLYIKGLSKLILNCDMSSFKDNYIAKYGNGTLAFKLTAANENNCNIVIENWDQSIPRSTVEFLEGGIQPKCKVTFRGGNSSIVRNLNSTVLGDLTHTSDTIELNDEYKRVETFGNTLTIGAGDDVQTKSRALSPIFAKDGSFVLQAERIFRSRDLPIGGTLELKRGDYEAECTKGLHVICWKFDDPTDPRKDLLGYGSRMLMPKGDLSIVNDPERGNVVKFEGGKCFKGPDADGGLDGLFLQEKISPFTVSFWFKPDQNCDRLAKLFFWGDTEEGKAVALRLNTTPGKPFMFTNWSNNKEVSSNVDLFDGRWHHIMVGYNGGAKFYLYLDGILLTEAETWKYEPSNKNFYIGSVGGGWITGGDNNPFTGLMDDFYVSCYCFTEDDVARLYNQGIDSMIGTASVAIEHSGTLSLADRNWTVGALSGEGMLGGIEMRGNGDKKLTIGNDATGQAEYKALLRGENLTVEKIGAGYKQILSGKAENVTNLVIREGEVEVRRPMMRRGQVVHYSFDEKERLLRDDGVADLTLSSVGESAPSYIADGVRGGAIRFTNGAAVNSGTSFHPSNFPSGNNSYTISVWIRPTAEACANETPFVCWGNPYNYQLVYLRFVSATELRYSNYSLDMGAQDLDRLDDGKWHHIVATYDATKRKKYLYVDGIKRSEQDAWTDLEIPSAYPLRLAQKWDNSLQYTGDMDELTICDYAWSADEVAREYKLDNPQKETTPAAFLPSPIAHWTFDDSENPGTDSSGNGFDLTMTAPVEVEEGGLICGKAARVKDDSGYFKLETVPELFPQGEKELTIIYRVKPDTEQISDGFGTVLTWGDANAWAKGWLVKLGMRNGRGGVRLTVCGKTEEDQQHDFVENNYYSVIGTERLRWQTIAVTYSPQRDNTKRIMQVYYDGKMAYKLETLGEEKALNLKPQDFAIGAMSTGTGRFRGLIDDVQIYDKALSSGQIRYLSEQLSGVGGDSVLEANTAVVVAQNAKFKVASNERISSIAGEGAVEIAPLATLSVGSIRDFAGTLTGNGTVELNDLAVSTLEGLPFRTTCGISFAANGTIDWAKDLYTDGWTALVTADSGIVGVENLASWPINGFSGRIRFSLSQDGKSLLGKAIPNRFMVIMR